MIRSSVGQMNAELAKTTYQLAGKFADNLVAAGKIAASDRGTAFAKIASSNLTRYGIRVSKEMAETARSALPAVDAMLAKSTAEAVVGSGSTTAAAAVAKSTATSALKSFISSN